MKTLFGLKLRDVDCDFRMKSQFFNFPRVARTLMDLTRLWWELVVRRDHLKDASAPRGMRARSHRGQ